MAPERVVRRSSEENEQLINEHLAFAKRLARRFYRVRVNLGIEFADFEGAALLGLCEAARLFDKSRGTDFRSFSLVRIRGAMYDMLRWEGDTCRRAFNSLVINVSQEEHYAEGKYYKEKPPYAFARTASELASLSSVLAEAGIKVVYTNKRGKVEICYADSLNPELITIERSARKHLALLIEKLPVTEREVIKQHYFGEDKGRALSRSWGSRVRGRALQHLRESLLESAQN